MTRTLRALVGGLVAGALLASGLAQVAVADATTPVLTGTVIGIDDQGISGAEVLLCPWVDGSAPDCDNGTVTTTTDGEGAYSLAMSELAVGTTYAVSVAASGHWTTWLGDTVVAAPQTQTAGNSVARSDSDVAADPVHLPKKYQLTGTVVDADEAGIDGLAVKLWGPASTADPADEDATASGGKFSLTIPYDAGDQNGSVSVDGGASFANLTRDVTLQQKDTDLGSLELTEAQSSATGLVTDGSGAGLKGVRVTSLRWSGEGFEDYASATTDDSGSYTVAVPAGKRFSVRYDADGYATEFLGGGKKAPTAQNDEIATRAAPAVGEAALPLPTPALESTHRVSGTVLLPGLDPATSVTVAVYAAGHVADAQPIYQAWTESDGSFTVDVEPGTYDFVFTNGNESLAVGEVRQDAVAVNADLSLGELSLPVKGRQVTGQVIDEAGMPISGARVTSYLHVPNPELPSTGQGLSVLSDASGNFVLPVVAGARFTFKVRLNGYQTRWYGALGSAPDQLDDTNSLVASDDLSSVGSITLFASTSSLGKVAGQKLAYCNSHTLRANDDGSTKAADLPFPVKFYGQEYSSVYVNNNGNVTFGKPLAKYTPGDLASNDQPAPMIAPFFADVDTRNDASWEVTYGSSPAGDVFCVNWATVGYYDEHADKLNVVQLLLTKPTGVPEGDFDITFNYDQITWETGDASDGADGYGGVSAAVGYTAGTGDPGTYFQMLGSREPGSFLDSGPRALVAGQLNSGQVGRYRFEIRNATAQVKIGELRGVLKLATDASPVEGATVQACRTTSTDSSNCQFVTSGADGSFSFPNLGIGDYEVVVSPPGTLRGVSKAASVKVGEITDVGTLSLSGPDPIPSGSSITNVGIEAGVPVVYYDEPLHLSIPNPCASGTAVGTWKVDDAGGATLQSGPLTAEGASLVATIPQLYPYHGTGRVETAVTCDGAAATSPAFDIYIDPSGTVYDRYGAPLNEASVTLLRADTADGEFAAVPQGSTLMDPSNRNNPVVVGTTGAFQWNVAPGWYKLKVTKAGCNTVTTQAMAVPPARIDLGVKLTCGAAPTPTTPATVTGTAALGSTLTVHGAAFAAGSPFTHQSFAWKRDGVVVSSASTYKISSADLGHTLSVADVFQAPSIASNVGSEQLSFDRFESAPALSSWVLPLGVFTAPTPVIAAPATLKPGTVLTAKTGTWSPAATLRIVWRVGGVAVRTTGSSYKIQLADLGKPITVSVTGSATGYATKTVTSAAVTAKAYRLTSTSTPKVSGTAKVGKTVKAVVKTWKPSPVRLSYQWLRNGKPIAKATGSSYRITQADLGAKLSVQVSGSKTGYVTVVKSSKATKKVVK